MPATTAKKAPVEVVVTKTMKDNAANFFLHNRSANAFTSSAKKFRTSLYTEMKAEGVGSFELTIDAGEEGKFVTDVEIGSPTGEAADVRELWNQLGLSKPTSVKQQQAFEQFMDAVQAPKGVIEDMFGKGMFARISKPTRGEENVKVAARK